MIKTATIAIVLNQAAGLRSNQEARETITRILTEAGLETSVYEPEPGTDLCELTRKIMRDGAGTVVAAGGDGTVNAVASVVSGTEVALGVLPVGTLNHFARDLGIPIDLEQATRIIAEARVARVDVGEVNDRRFINNAIIGLYPIYRMHRERQERHGKSKWRAIASAVIDVFRYNPALRVHFGIEGEVRSVSTPFLMVANNQHEMEGYRLGTRSALNEGRLWLYVMHRMTRLGLMGLAISVLLGCFSKQQDFDLFSAREIVVESRRRRISVSLDGEVVKMLTPLRYRSIPGALRVVVPSNRATRS